LSYEVIARRWRPQDFSGLIGQDHIRTTLQNALANNRLHHALLFTGPRGTGKTSTARILAKSLRCPNAQNFVPCNTCSECEEIASGRSLNVVEIDGASNNGVDAIRELRDTVGYMPSSGKYKLYIIDEVHMLSTSAFNALLKTLEEPPEHVYFVMATTEVQKIPNTILSRCQRFDFRRIPTRVIAQHLQTICERDGVEFETDALWTIARQGDGSMRDAQSLLDQTINFTNGKLQRTLVVATLGLTDRGLLMDLLTAILQRKTGEVIEGLKRLHASGGDPKLFLLDLMEQLRHTLLLKLSSDRTLVDLPDSEQEALAKLGGDVTAEDLHFLFDLALKGAQDLVRATDTLLVLEMVLLRMANAPRIAPLQTTRTNPGAARPAPAPTTPNGPLDQRYREVVEKIKEVNGLIGAQLENCFPIRMEQKVLTLGVAGKHKFLFDKINQPDFKKKVGNYLNSFWGPGYGLNVILADNAGATEPVLTPKALSEKMEEDRQQSVRQAVEAHPLVQTAQSVFKTEIKSIKESPITGGNKR
jgi:DNA polymerase-3 subunit gamma/tau